MKRAGWITAWACVTAWLSSGMAMGLAAPEGPRAGARALSEGTLITAVGAGQVSRPADRASLQVGVTMTADTAADAIDKANKKLLKVIEAIKKLELRELVLQTQGPIVTPVYEFGTGPRQERRLVGYQASSTLFVQMDDPHAAGSVTDAASVAGANEFSGVTFSLRDELEAKLAAQRLATREAAKKGEVIADTLGLKISGVAEASSEVSTRRARPWPGDLEGGVAMEMTRAAAPTPTESGEIVVSASATVVFRAFDPKSGD